MTAAAVIIAGVVAGFTALGALIGRWERRHPPQRGWDWPEDTWPSPYGWEGREQL